jgi:hypothetical protein
VVLEGRRIGRPRRTLPQAWPDDEFSVWSNQLGLQPTIVMPAQAGIQ